MSHRRKPVQPGSDISADPPVLLVGLTALDQERIEVSREIADEVDRLWQSGKQPIAVIDENGEVVQVDASS